MNLQTTEHTQATLIFIQVYLLFFQTKVDKFKDYLST